MFEAEVKTIATWVNSKFDILGETVPEAWEQAGLEFVIQSLVNLTPENFRGLPLRQMLVNFAVQWIKEPEAQTAKVANFLESQQGES